MSTLAPKEVADELHVHYRTAMKLIRSGAIPSFKIGARTRRVKVSDLAAYEMKRRAVK